MLEDKARIAEYDALIASGMSDYEARGTVWPDEVETEPNYKAAQQEFLRVTAFWAPEWIHDTDMFAKMLDSVLDAAKTQMPDIQK